MQISEPSAECDAGDANIFVAFRLLLEDFFFFFFLTTEGSAGLKGSFSERCLTGTLCFRICLPHKKLSSSVWKLGRKCTESYRFRDSEKQIRATL